MRMLLWFHSLQDDYALMGLRKWEPRATGEPKQQNGENFTIMSFVTPFFTPNSKQQRLNLVEQICGIG
jgi:hypothetical protein